MQRYEFKRGRSGQLLRHAVVVSLFVGAIGPGSAGSVLAQNAVPPALSSSDKFVDICSSVSHASCVKEPAPDTPVPKQFQASYQVYLKMKAAAHGGQKLTWQTTPDWSGLWNHAGGFSFDPQPNRMANGAGGESAQAILDHCSSFPCQGWMTAALRPKYALQYRQKLTAVAHGYEWDQLSNCLPAGFPRFLVEPVIRQFIITPQQTMWMNEWETETRHIYTDGRGHIWDDEAFPLWDGDSIGFWDGDALVVHTMRVKPEELQRNQPSISGQASMVERIRMTGPDTIEDVFTLWDPIALERPWHGHQIYTRITTPGIRLDTYSCDENNNVIQGEHGTSTFILPGETVMIPRHYRDPSNFQNEPLDRAIAYGAQLMKDEGAAKAKMKAMKPGDKDVKGKDGGKGH